MKRRGRPRNADKLVSVEQLQRSLAPFRIGGWGEHVFRYAIQIKPHKLVLTERRMGEWRIIYEKNLQARVGACIRQYRAEPVVLKTSERELV